MTNRSHSLRRVVLITGVAVVVSTLVALGVEIPLGGRGMSGGGGMGTGRAMAAAFEPVVQIKVFLSTFNLVVILALGWAYLSVYRSLPNPFTRSLLVVTLALFFYALASNPVISLLFGYRGLGLGPFTFLPDLFAAVAVVVLLYQSYQ